MPDGGIRLDTSDIDRFLSQLRRATDVELPGEIGKVHKEIGRMVISKLRPPAVGAGAGASVRPSAAKREVLLRVGFGGRNRHALQWGRRQVWPGGSAPARPDILGTAQDNEAEMIRMFEKGINRALVPPFE